MKNLITGVQGFLGKHLAQHLKSQSPEQELYSISRSAVQMDGVKHFACDLSDETSVTQIIESIKPDRIYHLAGNSRVTDDISFPEYFSKNFLTTMGLLSALKKLDQPAALFFTSSVHVYGNQEEEVNEKSSVHPVNPYGFTKYLAEEAIRHQCGQKLRTVIGRLYSCIGPGQDLGFVASDLCARVAALPKSGGSLSTGTLLSYRRFSDVRDVVKIFPRLLDNPQSNYEIFNIASPYEMRIQDLLENMLQISGKSPKIESSADIHVNKFMGLRLDTKKLTQHLPPGAFRPIKQTIVDMFQWHVDFGSRNR